MRMKSRTLFGIGFFFLTISGYSQDYAFKVLANKGANEYKSGMPFLVFSAPSMAGASATFSPGRSRGILLNRASLERFGNPLFDRVLRPHVEVTG